MGKHLYVRVPRPLHSRGRVGRRVIILLVTVLPILGAWEFEYVRGEGSEPFIKGAYWTYAGTLKSEVVGAGECAGSYTYFESMQGQVTVKSANESTLVIENSKEGDVSTYLEGCVCHKQGSKIFSPSGSFRYTQVGSDAIDRKTLAYTSSMVGLEYRASLIGMPAHDFVATTLKEGQLIPYCYLGQEINCSVKYGTLEFQGASIPVIILQYYGPISSWMPLAVKGRNVYWNGTADYTFSFERQTGLLISHSIKETIMISNSALNMRGCTLANTNTGNYTVRSVSWEISKPSQTPTSPPTSTLTPTPTDQQTWTTTPPSTPKSALIDSERWLPATLIGILLIITTIVLVLRRKKLRKS